MKTGKRAILIALTALLLMAMLPSAVSADPGNTCSVESDCGVCTDALPVCCIATPSGVGVCVAYSDAGSSGGEKPVPQPQPQQPTTYCRKVGAFPVVGGYTYDQVVAQVMGDNDGCPDTYYRMKPRWLGLYKLVMYWPN